MNHHPKTRLGVDIGTNSIGWWLYATDGKGITGIIDGGVRIFSDGRDPKSGTSLAVDRRLARSMRRRQDRYLRRRTALMRRMVLAGLMPGDRAAARSLERLDPFELRARGLDEALPLAHLGRALFHINQRRGFKSNRKADRGNNESGLIGDASARLDQAMMAARARSYGEFLHICRSDKPEKPPHQHKTNKDGTRSDDRRTRPVRTRLSAARRDGAKKEKPGYDFYPDRRHLEEEFSTLWHSQFTHHQNAKDNNQTITAREWRWDKDHRRFTSVNVQCEACLIFLHRNYMTRCSIQSFSSAL